MFSEQIINVNKSNITQILGKRPLVIYGAGMTARVLCRLIRSNSLEITAFIDDDENKQGTYIDEIEVISFTSFKEKYQDTDTDVILGTIYITGVINRLQQCSKLQIYEMYDWYAEECGQQKYVNDLAKPDNIALLKEKFNELKKNLADQLSKNTLDALLTYFTSRELNDLLMAIPFETQYFIKPVLDAIKEPLCIVDAGAYKGELLQDFKNLNIDVEKWYCFEADKDSFMQLVENRENNNQKNQECIFSALADKKGKLFFELNGTASRIVDYETENVVETIFIDEYFQKEKINFIKMDIEGAEYASLIGGMNVIKRDCPILAISIYHSLQDLYRIPELLMNELENYKFYIRHHAAIFCETVLYAIPEEKAKSEKDSK